MNKRLNDIKRRQRDNWEKLSPTQKDEKRSQFIEREKKIDQTLNVKAKRNLLLDFFERMRAVFTSKLSNHENL
jgi:hypothetical protein